MSDSVKPKKVPLKTAGPGNKMVGLDLTKMFSDIVESNFDTSWFNQIDESGIPKAPNFYQFAVGREFCNSTLLPWQVEAGMHLFSEFCPHCTPKEYQENLFSQTPEEIKQNIVFLEFGVCPKCHKNRLELFSLPGILDAANYIKNEMIAALGQRSGKCLEAGTEVLTPKGPVAIEKLQAGDTVYGYEEDGSIKPTRVGEVIDQGIQEVTELTYYKRKVVASTENHRWLTRLEDTKGVSRVSTRKPRELKDIKKHFKFERLLVDIPCGDVHEPHSYVLGALLGDGCSKQGSTRAIHLSSSNEAIPEKIAGILKLNVHKNPGDNYTWALNTKEVKSKGVYGEEINLNHWSWLFNKYAHEKTVDLDVIKTWDRESLLQFLAGLIDTDGSVYLSENKYGQPTSLSIQFGCQAKPVVEAFCEVFYILYQYRPYLDEDKRPKYKNGSVWCARLKNNFYNLKALRELDPFLVSPQKKWKEEYVKLPIRNTHENYVALTKGKTYSAQTYDITVTNSTHLYVLANLGLVTHNSMCVASFALYLVHRWLKEPDPFTKFNLPTNVLIDSTLTALTADQAERNLWIPFKQLYEKSPWFIRYNKFLDEESKRLGKELYQNKESFIFYKHKQLLIQYDGSNNSTQRGATRLFAAIDELAFFNNDEDTKNKRKVQDASGSYTALNNSLATLRTKATQLLRKGDYEVVMPVMFNVSSPLSVNDMVMQLVRSSATNPYCFCIHRASWEANPDYTRADLRASNANLSEEKFMRDFGAIPPFSDSPFISEARTLERLCTSTEVPIVRFHREIYNDPMGDRYLYLDAKVQRQDKMTPRLLALDNGYNNNAFSACLFRYDVTNQKPVLELAVSLAPKPGLPVNFNKMYEHFLKPMVLGLNLRHVFFDRWQSLGQIHSLREAKVDAQAYSLRYDKDFLPMRQMLQDGHVTLPMLEEKLETVKQASNPVQYVLDYPVTNLVWQALTVREVGKKLLKPQQGDDDIFRSFSLGVTRFLDKDFVKEYLRFGGGNQSGVSNRAVGGVMTLSRGVSGNSSSGMQTDHTGRVLGSFRGSSRR